uniref:Uncharacterized protein n=1 Tax=Cacopsylla melanoneura TaxID=428564 RepID=A0A8D8WBY9_9HEMI
MKYLTTRWNGSTRGNGCRRIITLDVRREWEWAGIWAVPTIIWMISTTKWTCPNRLYSRTSPVWHAGSRVLQLVSCWVGAEREAAPMWACLRCSWSPVSPLTS